MTATQRIRSMLDGSPVKEIGACGWLHTIGADRDTAEVFSSAIIKMTDYSNWSPRRGAPNPLPLRIAARRPGKPWAPTRRTSVSWPAETSLKT